MPQSLPFSWKDSRILVADDEPDMREIFAAWFRNLGCTVTEAVDGKDALDALATERFDAVVTDVRMPKINGVELVLHLHHSGRYVPVIIFISGFVDLPLPDAFDLGVEAVLSKPCEKSQLINAVQRSLLRRNLVFDSLDTVALPAPENYLRQSFPRGLTAAQIAVGRGGMSLEIHDRIPQDQAIGFSLTFAEGPLTNLSGWGVVRWSESTSLGTRFGIEFLHLEDETLRQFAHWLEHDSPVSFIPKDCNVHSVTSASP